MFIRKYQPVFAPEGVDGSAEDIASGGALPVVEREAPDGPGSGRTGLRKALESSVKELTEASDAEEKKRTVASSDKAKPNAKAAKSRAREELEAQEAEAAELEAEGGEEIEGEEPAAIVAPAPEAWSREAKAVWEQVPPAAQAAIAKREADVAKGVDQLKKQYAELDSVLAPRLQVIKEMGHTPAQAVNQLWAWFDALGQDPIRLKNGQPPMALFALAHSFGIDLAGLMQQRQQQQQQPANQQQQDPAQQQQGQEQEVVPNWAQQYIGQLEQKVNQLGQMVQGGFQQFQQTFQDQSMKETTGIMESWAKDKPYFEDVRRSMAYIIGSKMIDPLPNGQADLDKAYEMAIWSDDKVREKILADRRAAAIAKRKEAQEKEKQLQQQAADKARRAGVSSNPSSPGVTTNVGGKPKRSSKSVRESIADAVEELGG